MADIHGIGDAVLARPDGLIDPRLHEAWELIVLIGGCHELFDWETHPQGNQPAHQVAEVAAGNGEDHLLPTGCNPGVSIEVIDRLGQQPTDIYGVG